MNFENSVIATLVDSDPKKFFLNLINYYLEQTKQYADFVEYNTYFDSVLDNEERVYSSDEMKKLRSLIIDMFNDIGVEEYFGNAVDCLKEDESKEYYPFNEWSRNPEESYATSDPVMKYHLLTHDSEYSYLEFLNIRNAEKQEFDHLREILTLINGFTKAYISDSSEAIFEFYNEFINYFSGGKISKEYQDKLKKGHKEAERRKNVSASRSKATFEEKRLIVDELNRLYESSNHKSERLKKSDAYSGVVDFLEEMGKDLTRDTLARYWKKLCPEKFIKK